MDNALPTLPCLNTDQNANPDELIESYFVKGFTYLEVKEFLETKHEVQLSLSTIKRRLKAMNLYRRPLQGRRVSNIELENYLRLELNGSGSNIGYRRLWTHLKRIGVLAKREDVRLMVLQLDPDGVEIRRKRRLKRRMYCNPGPNNTWHLDGHDKLKPFGFSVHGCIDGFSRRLIWLEVASTNRKPELIANYYLSAVKQLKGVPEVIKADDGTEHSIIEPMHVTLREDTAGEHAVKTFSIVSSPLNQRIESFWSKLRGDRLGWWRSFFQDLLDLELFNPGDPCNVDCIRFCFIHLIREDLNDVANEWNQHIISSSLNGGPRGRPDSMYFLPHLFDTEDHLQPVDFQVVDEFVEMTSDVRLPSDFSEEFKEFADMLMTMHNQQLSVDAETGLNLYMFLLRQIQQYS